MKKFSLIILFFFNVIHAQLTIDFPGEFTLGGDLTTTGTAIIINVSNVTLNLNARVVTSDSDGILISSGLSNVVIRNGEIRDISGTGIIIEENCNNIVIEKVSLVNCAQSALDFQGSSGNEITKCRLSNLRIFGCCTGAGSTAAISVAFANDIQIRKSQLVQNGSGANTLSLISISDSNRSVFEDMQLRDNTALSLTAVECGTDTQNCVFRNCLILDNSGTVGLTGFLFTGTSSIQHQCSKCNVSNNMVMGAATGPLYGYHVVEGERILLEHCTALNNCNAGTAATSHTFGFYFDQVEKCSAILCKSFYNFAPNDGGSNLGAGFFIGTTAGAGTGVKNSAFIGNEAVGNAGFTDERSFGILLSSGNNGNEGNAYVRNAAYLNGVSDPLAETQITSKTGAGSNPGGVSFNAVKSQSITKLNGISDVLSNLRIGG